MSTTERTLAEVAAERGRQDELWGEQNYDPYMWLAILVEEVGEVGEALNDKAATVEEYREELIQVAAVAVAAVESLDRRLGTDDR